MNAVWVLARSLLLVLVCSAFLRLASLSLSYFLVDEGLVSKFQLQIYIAS